MYSEKKVSTIRASTLIIRGCTGFLIKTVQKGMGADSEEKVLSKKNIK